MPSQKKKKGSHKKKKSGSQKKKHAKRHAQHEMKVGGEAIQPRPPSTPAPDLASPTPARTHARRAPSREAPPKKESSSDDEDVDDGPTQDVEPIFTGPADTKFYFIKPEDEQKTKGSANACTDAQKAQEEYDDRRFEKPVFPNRNNLEVSKGDNSTDVFCTTYSEQGLYLVAGCGDGSVRCFNSGGKLQYKLSKDLGDEALPITCIRFRPRTSTSTSKHVMLVASADGTVSHWHMTSNSCLFTTEEEDNQVYAIDYRKDGETFATAGRDAKVRVYDEQTKSLITTLSGGSRVGNSAKGATGHSNRVYAVKCLPSNDNVIVSGGWDNTIQIWDIRSGRSERSIYGPHICGDALDISPDGQHILTGSWRPEQALQMWDFGSGKLFQDIEWQLPTKVKGRPEFLYSARFSKNGRLIAATGTGTKEMKIFERDGQNNYKALDRVKIEGAYSCCFSPNGRQVAVGGEKDRLITADIDAAYQ